MDQMVKHRKTLTINIPVTNINFLIGIYGGGMEIKPNEFPNSRRLSMIDLREFKEYFVTGREIEFYYHNIMYFVTEYSDRSVVLKVSTDSEPEKILSSAKNRLELFEITRINGKKLEEICSDITIGTVF